MKENAMSADEDLHRLSDMGRASLMPFVKITDGGTVYFDFSQPDAKKYLHLIKKIKTKRTRRVEDGEKWEDEFVEVELYDSQSALALIAKYHNLIVDRTDITSKGEKITPDDHGYDRSIHELADAIREIIPGASAEKNSIVDTPEQTSVAGPIIKG